MLCKFVSRIVIIMSFASRGLGLGLVFLLIILQILSAKYVQIDTVIVFTGDNLGRRVPQRVMQHLGNLEDVEVISMNNHNQLPNSNETSSQKCLVVSFGNTAIANEQELNHPIKDLDAESFQTILTTRHSLNHTCKYALFANGLPISEHQHKNISFDRYKVHYGALVGTYASLEMMGFGFLHPLEPYTPSYIKISDCNHLQDDDCHLVRHESPYWPERSFHIHTQHPLELTEVLQGHDIPQFGPHGPECSEFSKAKRGQFSARNGSVYCERWEDMVDDVNRLYEWAVANRLNKLEWLLLGHYQWEHELDTRLQRLKLLTALGHDYSLLIGADCPIGNQQQHAWYMVNTRLPLNQQYKQIRERVDWIFNAGFDFLSTESGLSEFTHPECEVMLGLMNEFANYINGTWGREAAIKVHCSTGQVCEHFLDPNTGDPVNFNFLTMFATPSLGVFPHTVQVYSFDDPTAGAYGNANFSYMEDYLVTEAKLGNRTVVYYGETAYWVNVDVDVPLFLPLYGQRRLYDLRRIAWRERREGFRMHGQMNFDSGWEWGYWISDVVTARASWDPLNSSNMTDVNYDPKQDQWSAFAKSMEPVTRVFGESTGDQVNAILVELAQMQSEVLLHGRVKGKSSPNLKKLSGMPYLSGDDTWIDLPRMFKLSLLQPDKVHFQETSDPDWKYVIPLLSEMDEVFGGLADRMERVLEQATDYANANGESRACIDSTETQTCEENTSNSEIVDISRLVDVRSLPLLEEIADSIRVLALRARQVRLLYESRDHSIAHNVEEKASLLRLSRGVIQTAASIVARRESHYRVPWQRVAAWRENPTVYRFGYLWAVHSLYYWWRDQGIAEGGSFQSEFSPCYLNRMDASEVAVGWGKYALQFIRWIINRYSPFSFGYPLELVNCLSPPQKEYVFPRDLYHH